MARSTFRAVPAAALLAVAACAAPGVDGVTPAGPPSEQRYQVAATVLESPEHGPQLCQAVATSLPPQCGGPDIVGWDWEAVESESAGGTTWGAYQLVGTWDGERFTLSEPARPAGPESAAGAVPGTPDFVSPCPEPDGGWRPHDPARATVQAQEEALARAAQAPDYAGAWLDQSYLDDLDVDRDDPTAVEELANDPTRLVLNVRFTGNPQEREQWIRQVWGGALCVTTATRTLQELLDIQQELHRDYPDLLGSGVDEVGNAVVAQVPVASPELQRQLDDRYGEGAVILDGWLQPVD
jgi:hypothetical protein